MPPSAAEAHGYVLTTPVASATERIALESGTASDSDIQRLLIQHGAVAVDDLDATLVLEGRRSGLRVIDIRPRVRPVRAEPSAAFLKFPAGGTVSALPLALNLDRPFPALRQGARPYFPAGEIDLKRGERQSLRISFTATRGYHEVSLVMTYMEDGRRHEQNIPGPVNGVFQVTGRATDYHAYGTVYTPLSAHQFVPAGKADLCRLFPTSKGC